MTTTSFTVNSADDLANDLQSISSGGANYATDTTYTITFGSPGLALTLAAQLSAINLGGGSSLTIDGNNGTLDGANTYQGFFVEAGTVTLQNLTISHMLAQGGAGSSGGTSYIAGDGGLGAGGGLFVGTGSTVTIDNVNFTGDKAVGGQGGVDDVSIGYYGANGQFVGYPPYAGQPTADGNLDGIPGLTSSFGAGTENGYGGGGGQGDGGAIFVQTGGTLLFAAGSVSGDSVSGGAGGAYYGKYDADLGSGSAGSASGAGIFFQDTAATLDLDPAVGQTVTISDQVTAAGSYSLNGTYYPSYYFNVDINGGGTVVLDTGLGNYYGTTTVEGDSTLQLTANGFSDGLITMEAGSKLQVADGGDVSGLEGSGQVVAAGALNLGSYYGSWSFDGTITVATNLTLASYGSETILGGVTDITGALEIAQQSIYYDGGWLVVDNNMTVGGGTTIDAWGTLQLGNGDAAGTISGNINIASNGELLLDRTDTFNFQNSVSGGGSVVQEGTGTLILAGTNDYSGGTTIDSGTLELANAGAAGSGAITFANAPGTDPTLEFTAANQPTNEIDGFGPGDSIQIDDFIATSAPNYSDNVLTLQGTDPTGHTGETITLDMPGLLLANFEVVAGPGHSDTTIDYVACYCAGTLITTARRQMPIESLKIGDMVKTMSGEVRPIKWIGRRSYGGRFVVGRKDILPICIKAGALDDNVPRRDLWVSPHHAMYIDGVLIEAKDLLNGVSIVQAERVEKVEYFHIELDSHDVIIAEGALSETFIDDHSRGMFHNADEYRLLYPQAPAAVARYRAPRLEEGYEVEAARRRVALRAGLQSEADQSGIGALRGYIDLIEPNCIAGWAQNVDHPEAPVCLHIYAGGRLIGQSLANRYRRDLERAGLGSGRHSFAFTAPSGVIFAPETVEVRRALDGSVLKLSDNAKQLEKRLVPSLRLERLRNKVAFQAAC